MCKLTGCDLPGEQCTWHRWCPQVCSVKDLWANQVWGGWSAKTTSEQTFKACKICIQHSYTGRSSVSQQLIILCVFSSTWLSQRDLNSWPKGAPFQGLRIVFSSLPHLTNTLIEERARVIVESREAKISGGCRRLETQERANAVAPVWRSPADRSPLP